MRWHFQGKKWGWFQKWYLQKGIWMFKASLIDFDASVVVFQKIFILSALVMFGIILGGYKGMLIWISDCRVDIVTLRGGSDRVNALSGLVITEMSHALSYIESSISSSKVLVTKNYCICLGLTCGLDLRPFGPPFLVFRSNMTFRSECFQQDQAFF